MQALKHASQLLHGNLKQQNQVWRQSCIAHDLPINLPGLSWPQMLDRTEKAANQNQAELDRELQKTNEHLKRKWNSTLASCFSIVLLLGVFLFTFLFMRLFPKRRLLLW